MSYPEFYFQERENPMTTPNPSMMPKTRKDETPKKEYHIQPHLKQRPLKNHEGLAALRKSMSKGKKK